ncbi:MAG: hypothetical protein ACYCPO_15460 [Acidobacteriaceae bacterium]
MFLPHREKSGTAATARRIPQRYPHCSLESFDTGFRGADPSLGTALMTTRRLAEGYPLETGGRGLLFTGGIGAAKPTLP